MEEGVITEVTRELAPLLSKTLVVILTEVVVVDFSQVEIKIVTILLIILTAHPEHILMQHRG